MIHDTRINLIMNVGAQIVSGSDAPTPLYLDFKFFDLNLQTRDLQLFKCATFGRHCIVGRKTYDVLPKAAHVEREFTIVTRRNIELLPLVFKDGGPGEVFIIGGAQTYELFADFADYLYLGVTNNFYGQSTPLLPGTDKLVRPFAKNVKGYYGFRVEKLKPVTNLITEFELRCEAIHETQTTGENTDET